jgi:hypothetical protein
MECGRGGSGCLAQGYLGGAVRGVAEDEAGLRARRDPLDGTAVTGQLVALWEELGLDGFALDPKSPSSTLVEPLTAEGMVVRQADAAGLATAHGMFADYLRAGRLRISGHPALDEAVRAAEARRLAGQDAVDRYADGGAEMAPLLAAELACWMLGDPEQAGGIEAGAWLV